MDDDLFFGHESSPESRPPAQRPVLYHTVRAIHRTPSPKRRLDPWGSRPCTIRNASRAISRVRSSRGGSPFPARATSTTACASMRPDEPRVRDGMRERDPLACAEPGTSPELEERCERAPRLGKLAKEGRVAAQQHAVEAAVGAHALDDRPEQERDRFAFRQAGGRLERRRDPRAHLLEAPCAEHREDRLAAREELVERADADACALRDPIRRDVRELDLVQEPSAALENRVERDARARLARPFSRLRFGHFGSRARARTGALRKPSIPEQTLGLCSGGPEEGTSMLAPLRELGLTNPLAVVRALRNLAITVWDPTRADIQHGINTLVSRAIQEAPPEREAELAKARPDLLALYRDGYDPDLTPGAPRAPAGRHARPRVRALHPRERHHAAQAGNKTVSAILTIITCVTFITFLTSHGPPSQTRRACEPRGVGDSLWGSRHVVARVLCGDVCDVFGERRQVSRAVRLARRGVPGSAENVAADPSRREASRVGRGHSGDDRAASDARRSAAADARTNADSDE